MHDNIIFTNTKESAKERLRSISVPTKIRHKFEAFHQGVGGRNGGYGGDGENMQI